MDKLTLKISIILSFIAVFVAAFFLINHDFKGTIDYLCKSSAERKMERYGIPTYWLDRYGLAVESAADLKSDSDNDELSLEDEFKYFTDPTDPDTDKDKYADGVEIKAGYDPTSTGRLDFDKDGLPDIWEEEVGLDRSSNDYSLDPDNDSLPNHLEFAHGTDPKKADTDGDSYSDYSEIKNGYDPSKPGDSRPNYSIHIQKIGVKAPITWSKSMLEEDLLKDLESGLIRYPKTGIPGQFGNAFITGHSSNYVWAKGDYNYILKDLNDIEVGDEIIITATQSNGKILNYRYIISLKEVVPADDQRMFEETTTPSITLSTCWPLGTNWKRLMVKAEFIT